MELSDFQRDLLIIMLGEEGLHSLGIKDKYEKYKEDKVYPYRCYSGLDHLVDEGLVSKTQVDGRTNEYEVTVLGQRVVASYHKWLTRRLEGIHPETNEQCPPPGPSLTELSSQRGRDED